MSVYKYHAFIFLDQPPPWPSRTRTLKGLVSPNSDRLFAAVYLLPKGGADLFLLLIWVTPSKFFKRPLWYSERSAGFGFASLKWKKFRCSRIRQIVKLADCLDAFAAIKSPGMRLLWSLFLQPCTKPGPGTTVWDFLAWNSAETLPEAASTVLTPDLAYSSSDGNHDVGGSFCHFVIFHC